MLSGHRVNIVQMSSNNGEEDGRYPVEQKEIVPPPSDLLVAQRCFFSREYRALESADIRV